jgi:hypothetical protein
MALAVAVSPIEGQTRFSAAIGAAVPIGGAADQTKIGYQTALAISLGAVGSPTRIRVEGAVAELSERVPAGVTRRLTYATANVLLSPVNALAAPSGYVIAGIGAYHQRVAGVGTDNTGLNIGAGVAFSFGRYGAFTEARLHYLISDAKTKLFPITFGLVF